MARVLDAAFLAIIFVLQQYVVVNAAPVDYIPSLRPPLSGDPCEGNVCGRGECIATDNSTFGYECECEEGWRQARYEDGGFLKFLPCVVPNCTLNYACEDTPDVDDRRRERQANLSIFDSCFWIDCGGGFCNQTSPLMHSCECDEGYNNLLNSTIFPCYREFATLLPSIGLTLVLTTMAVVVWI